MKRLLRIRQAKAKERQNLGLKSDEGRMADEKTAEQFGISSNTLRKDMKTPDLTIIPKNIKSPILAIIPLKQQGTVIYMATKEGPHLAGTKQGWNGSI